MIASGSELNLTRRLATRSSEVVSAGVCLQPFVRVLWYDDSEAEWSWLRKSIKGSWVPNILVDMWRELWACSTSPVSR